jgi:general stress protein YciG
MPAPKKPGAKPKPDKVDGEMSVREAGKKGGDTVRDRHGAEFYESIGQKGGKVVKEKYGPNFYEQIGHKGGQKVKKLIAEAKKNARRDSES